MSYKLYKKIGYELNPFNDDGNEPKYVVYTPDVERYVNTIKDCKRIINIWYEKNTDLETFRFHSDMQCGINRLTLIKAV
jgi:hypothetical protein